MNDLKAFVERQPLVIVLVLTVLAYALSLTNEFVWDDKIIVVGVPAYSEFDFAAMILGLANGLEYLPVRDLTLAIDFLLWSDNPFGFHLTNLVLYGLTSWVVFLLVERVCCLLGETEPQRIAMWTAILFALHPLHVEVVHFITGRNNILALLFGLLTVHFLLKIGRFNVALACCTFVLALFSKASLVFLPLALAGWWWLGKRKAIQTSITLPVVLLLMCIDGAAMLIHIQIAADSSVSNSDVWRFGSSDILWTLVKASQVVLFYLQKLLWPWPLTIYYPELVDRGSVVIQAIAGMICSLLICYLVWRQRQRSLIPMIAAVWFFLALGPVLNLFPTNPVVADRYAYPAVLGFALLLACGVVRYGKTSGVVASGAWVLVLTWFCWDVVRGLDWHNNSSLFRAAYHAYPKPVRNFYALELVDMGESAEALRVLSEAERDSYYAPLVKGLIHKDEGNHTAALDEFKAAIELGGLVDRRVLLSKASTEEALSIYQSALVTYLEAVYVDVFDAGGRMKAEALQGVERMRQYFQVERDKLLRRANDNPRDGAAQFNAALFLQQLGEYEMALEYYERFDQLDDRQWQPRYNQGLIHAKLDRHRLSVAAFESALQRNGPATDILNHMAIAYAALGDNDRALDSYQQALSIDPGFVQAAFNAGRLQFRMGNRASAIEYFEQARSLAKNNGALLAQIEHALEAVPK